MPHGFAKPRKRFPQPRLDAGAAAPQYSDREQPDPQPALVVAELLKEAALGCSVDVSI